MDKVQSIETWFPLCCRISVKVVKSTLVRCVWTNAMFVKIKFANCVWTMSVTETVENSITYVPIANMDSEDARWMTLKK